MGGTIVTAIFTAGFGIMLCRPAYTTKVVLVMRTFTCVFICASIVKFLEQEDLCSDTSVKGQIKFYKTVFMGRQGIINHYIVMSIFITPFCEWYFTTYLVSSTYFAIEMGLINRYYTSDEVVSLIYIPMWWMLMFLQTYFIRSIMT